MAFILLMIAILLPEFFKIVMYANYLTCDVTVWAQNDVKSQKWNISEEFFFIELKLCTVFTLKVP